MTVQSSRPSSAPPNRVTAAGSAQLLRSSSAPPILSAGSESPRESRERSTVGGSAVLGQLTAGDSEVVMAAMATTEVTVRVGLGGDSQITIQIDPTRARDELIKQLQAQGLINNLKEFAYVCVIDLKTILPDCSNLNDDDVKEAINKGIQLIPINEERRDILNRIKLDEFISLMYEDKKFQSDRYVVMVAVTEDWNELQYASDQLKGDREVVMVAVRKNERALLHASEELKADREFMMEAVKQNGNALLYASEELKGNCEFMMEAVKRYGDALNRASDGMKKNRDVVMAAVEFSGYALQYASKELRADREVVMEAVKQDGGALRYASEELRGDRDVVMAAVEQNGDALRYASQELQNDPNCIETSRLSQWIYRVNQWD